MDKKLDYLVYIGRFEPFHNGHLAVVKHALELADKVIVLIGSSNRPRTIKNPWTVAERQVMIETSLGDQASRLLFGEITDHFYNEDLWLAEVQQKVRELVRGSFDRVHLNIVLEPDDPDPSRTTEELIQRFVNNESRIGVIGQSKDNSSYYLHQFPQWKLIDVAHTETMSATDLRQYLFAADQSDVNDAMLMIRANVPKPVYDMLDAFRHNSPDFKQLVYEYRFIKDYKASWDRAPYPPTFVTTDAVVVYSGHILMVRRRAEPGKGLWALPGGFVGQDETLLNACLRGLREETKLRIPVPVLKGSLKSEKVFDHPDRSSRGRTITHGFYFHFQSGELPSVKGSDDADKARWIPIDEVLSMGFRIFEDHLNIIEYFIGQTAGSANR